MIYVREPLEEGFKMLNAKKTESDLIREIEVLQQNNSRLEIAREVQEEYSKNLEQIVSQRFIDFQKHQEELVRESKLTFLARLAEGIGHELGNPLGSIKNAKYFLNMTLDKTEPSVKEILKIIENEIFNAERIINGLLSFSQSKHPLFRLINLHEILQQAISQVLIPDNIHLYNDENNKNITFKADPEQLKLMFKIVISHALKSLKKGGGHLFTKIAVSSPNLIVVSFFDKTKPKSNARCEKIEESLFCLSNKGIGLELAIANSIVQSHDGEMELRCGDDNGIAVNIKLPYALNHI